MVWRRIIIPIIVIELEDLEKSINKDSSTTEWWIFCFFKYIKNKIFSFTLPLYNQSRSKSSDLSAANDHIENAICVLNKIFTNSHNKFDMIFEEIRKTLNDLGCEMNIPRCIKQHTNRNNIPSTSPLEYYKRSMIITFLDHIINKSLFCMVYKTYIFLRNLYPK